MMRSHFTSHGSFHRACSSMAKSHAPSRGCHQERRSCGRGCATTWEVLTPASRARGSCLGGTAGGGSVLGRVDHRADDLGRLLTREEGVIGIVVLPFAVPSSEHDVVVT